MRGVTFYQLSAALGLRSAVVTRYSALTELLTGDFGLAPERETRALYRALLGQQ